MTQAKKLETDLAQMFVVCRWGMDHGPKITGETWGNGIFVGDFVDVARHIWIYIYGYIWIYTHTNGIGSHRLLVELNLFAGYLRLAMRLSQTH